MIEEHQLEVGQKYKVRTGNVFVLFREYHPNLECFRRQDGELHFGREFIEFSEGKKMIDLEEV